MRVFQSLACAIAGVVAAAALTGRPALAQTQDHQYSVQDIEAGSRLYANQCSLCHGPNGDLISGIDLRRGQFRRPMSDDDLARVIATGIPGTGMPPFALPRPDIDTVIAFIRAGFDLAGAPVKVGQTSRGQALFEGKGGCATCHRVNGKGPRTAPDLSDIGAIRTAAVLQRKLIDPTATMLPINKPVRAVTRDGRTIRGRRLNEDTYTVQLIDDQERLVSLVKADLREWVVEKTSPMPSAGDKLTPDELGDVIAYLMSLKGSL